MPPLTVGQKSIEGEEIPRLEEVQYRLTVFSDSCINFYFLKIW